MQVDMQVALIALGLFVVTFLLGSIPWGVIISRVFFHDDIRAHGSGNIGTTNAMRTFGRAGGISVFVLDFGKGLLSGALALGAYVLMGRVGADTCALLAAGAHACALLASRDTLLAIAFLGCVYGHIFSPWLGFRGGKGIAVAIGALFIVFGVVGAVIELAVFIVVVATTRYVSAGSIASAIACPFLALWIFWGAWPAWMLCTIAALTVVWAHRENIARLRGGCERKIGDAR